ncbi:MAG: FxsA family protein [Spongiibacteraceae bacterium]
MRFLLLLFIIVPITEMWLLIVVGSKVGALTTIALVFLTAAIGLTLLRRQGISTLLKVNQRIEAGQLPAGEILEGVVLAVGGAMLLTPGFITDVIGFICLLPFVRKGLVAALLRQGLVMSRYGRGAEFRGEFYHSTTSGSPTSQGRVGKGEASGHNVIDGEFRRDK